MFRKLKWTFIGITMSLLAVVLVAVLVVFNVVSYNAEVDSIRSSLFSAMEMGPGEMGLPNIGLSMGGLDDDLLDDLLDDDFSDGDVDDVDDDDSTAASQNGMRPPHEGQGGRMGASIPVHCVTVSALGVVTDTSSGTYMDSDVLSVAVSRVSGTDDDFGELADLGLFFASRELSSGSTRMAFANSSDLHDSTTQRIFFSVLIGIGALAVLFVISLLLSKLAMRPVEEAWKGQQRFIADASHELKTPLTVILANNEIISSNPGDTVAEQSRWIESTHEEALKMQGLVQDMLVLAQTEPDNIQVADAPRELVTIDFSGMVEKDILQFEAVAFEGGVSIAEQIEPGLRVKADSERLERVVRVLLDNAIKYSKTGAAGMGDMTVRVSVSRERNSAVLAVNNGGSPIPPDDLPHVFDRFYRGDKARTEQGGFGLGLPIAYNIVTGLGGTISAASDAANGTTFTVKLPLA
ncbi:MAG: sensor histidine kinase [Coriobacteriales bacterium]|jgi:two-component system sensor histidine kinase CiaH